MELRHTASKGFVLVTVLISKTWKEELQSCDTGDPGSLETRLAL